MNRELTSDEARDQRTLLKILERNKLAEWLGGAEVYEQVTRNIESMQVTGTTDGEDLSELTDEDARERPWVMCSNNGDQWSGPYVLLSAPPITKTFLSIDSVSITCGWIYARQLTTEEKERYSDVIN